LGDGGVFERWFPNLPDVNTLTTVHPGDALFLLTSDPFLWTQSVSDAESAVDLVQGWNAVCYSGASGPVETVTSGIDLPYTVMYTLASDHTWQRFVPGNTEVCSLGELTRFMPVLILVTGANGRGPSAPDPSRQPEPCGELKGQTSSLVEPVGGIAELPDIAWRSSGATNAPSGGYVALAAGLAAMLAAFSTGAWYAKRRWGR
jgi:hypothetical protein